MNTHRIIQSQASQTGFDLFRLSKAKETVGVCANTLRAYHREGLPFYQSGKVVYVSKSDLDAFIRATPAAGAPSPKGDAV
jgi:hypothetical protein